MALSGLTGYGVVDHDFTPRLFIYLIEREGVLWITIQ